jgi:lipopolysaccharide transport system permease protein
VLWNDWGLALFVSTIAFISGFAFFQHSRDEFADVL